MIFQTLQNILPSISLSHLCPANTLSWATSTTCRGTVTSSASMLKDREQPTGSTQDTLIHTYGSDRQSRSKLPRRKRRWSRGSPWSLCPLQVENSMTLGFCHPSFCFLPTCKSDVATNPKPPFLSVCLTVPLSASKTHALFTFILLPKLEQLLDSELIQKENRPNKKARSHTLMCTRAHDHTIPLPECDAALNSLCFLHHCCGHIMQLLDQAATQGKWAHAGCC